MKKILSVSFLLALFISLQSKAENADSAAIKKFFNEVLTNSVAYKNLEQLVNGIGGRLSGSPEAAKAVEWTEKAMREAGADSVWLQEVMVPHWVRGEKEKGAIFYKN